MKWFDTGDYLVNTEEISVVGQVREDFRIVGAHPPRFMFTIILKSSENFVEVISNTVGSAHNKRERLVGILKDNDKDAYDQEAP